MPDVITLGEVLVDFVATVSGVSLADTPAFKKAPGGAPANVAAALARLGVSAGFMGKVGDDPFGHFLVDTLRALGVDTAAVRRSGERERPLRSCRSAPTASGSLCSTATPAPTCCTALRTWTSRTPVEPRWSTSAPSASSASHRAAPHFWRRKQPETPDCWSPTIPTCGRPCGPTQTQRGRASC